MSSWIRQAIIGVLIALPVLAPTKTHAMDLAQTWQLALNNDPTYQSARSQYRAMLQKTPQARAKLLPQVDSSLTGAYLDSRATGPLTQVYQGDRSAWSLSLTQPVFNWSAIQNFEQSKLVVAQAEINLQLAYQSLILRDEGGGIAKVQKVEVLDTTATPLTDIPGGGFDIDCHWQVHGVVAHLQHTHQRVNEYKATYRMLPRLGRWKITDVTINEQTRLNPNTLENAEAEATNPQS